jgi:hypothetical protein
MIKRIRFVPSDHYARQNIDPPISAKSAVPNWYRAGEMAISSETSKIAKPGDNNIIGGMKSCMPFLDAMISGYFICFWEDIYIKTSNVVEEFYSVEKNPYTDQYEKKQSIYLNMVEERIGDMGHTMPRPNGYCENHMVFKGQWGVRLPRGWSLAVTHPMNRFDLPFFTTSGIIDSDEWWTGGNIPFFFQKDFEGVILKGTPIAQIIPIKRSSWVSHVSELSMARSNYLGEKGRSVKMGWYKNNIWVKKEYK